MPNACCEPQKKAGIQELHRMSKTGAQAKQGKRGAGIAPIPGIEKGA
ncbi:MAG: hypothetical protein GY703_07880 [Gammaproteobacteria bacterium]|nr:hypothetical protein [Gammaproteobacteria bacterium]